MVFCIDTYRTWIEVADDNLYKEHVISRNTAWSRRKGHDVDDSGA